NFAEEQSGRRKKGDPRISLRSGGKDAESAIKAHLNLDRWVGATMVEVGAVANTAPGVSRRSTQCRSFACRGARSAIIGATAVKCRVKAVIVVLSGDNN